MFSKENKQQFIFKPVDKTQFKMQSSKFCVYVPIYMVTTEPLTCWDSRYRYPITKFPKPIRNKTSAYYKLSDPQTENYHLYLEMQIFFSIFVLTLAFYNYTSQPHIAALMTK